MDLYSKITALPTSKDSIVRPRVDALLERGMQFPAVVVAAGAGFGKTQAVAGFLSRSEYRAVWFQITLLDNLPMRFWESFVYTVTLHRPAFGEKLKNLGFPDSLYKYQKFLQALTEELYTDDKFVVFVFDDFQLLQDPIIAEFFKYFVSANLENICLLFITRNLESYSFHSAVHVLTTEDLRFTKEEAAMYFESREAIIENEKDFGTIYDYTGGWPMALYLISLQLQKKELQRQERILSSQQLIFKLIEKEVFSNYSEKEQKFFVALSQFAFFPRDLMREVGKYMYVQEEELLENNVFVSYDQKAKHYYLHQIFLDYLAEKRYMIDKATEEDMFCKAAEWSAKNGYIADAVSYYDGCGRQDKVWEVIESLEGMRHSKDEADFFISYMEKFSPEFMKQNPMARVVYAMMLLNNIEMKEAQKEIGLAHAQLAKAQETEENRLLLGEVHVGLGLISLGMENNEFVDCFKAANALLPNGSCRWGRKLRLVEYSNALNITSSKKGEVEKSVKDFFEGIPYVYKVLHGAGYGLEYLVSAEAAFFTNHLKRAEQDAYKAFHMAEEKQQADIADNALFLLLRIFLVSGDTQKIGEILKGLEKKEQSDDINLQGVSDIALGWFYTEMGMVEKVAGWILYNQLEERPPISVDKESLLHARCLIEKQNYFEALALLEKVEKLYRKRNTIISVIYANVYRAIAYYQVDDMLRATEAVKEAYALAHENNLIMPFIEYGHRTRSLLDNVRKQESTGIPDDWLASVQAKAATYAKKHAYIVSQFRDAPGRENFNLTQRETELLRNISQGLTRDEIAASMYVSPHTVKSMLKTVYNKIGAVNSADAVRIAISSDII